MEWRDFKFYACYVGIKTCGHNALFNMVISSLGFHILHPFFSKQQSVNCYPIFFVEAFFFLIVSTKWATTTTRPSSTMSSTLPAKKTSTTSATRKELQHFSSRHPNSHNTTQRSASWQAWLLSPSCPILPTPS